MKVSGNPRLALNYGGNYASYTGGSGSDTLTFTYTVQAGDTWTGLKYNSTGSLGLNGGTITDLAGNAGTQVTASTDASSVTYDKTAPSIDAHADISGNEATSSAGAVVTYTPPQAHDAIVGSFAATCTPSSGSTFALGTTTVTCNASDAAGNAATATTFDVGVVDTTAPVITLIGSDPISVALGNAWSDPGATSTDAVDGESVITAADSPDMNTAGTYTLHYDDTDAHGNAATQVTRTVTVSGSELDVTPSDNGDGTASGTLTNSATTTISSGSVNATVEIPAGVEVTGDDSWDGTIGLPQIITSSAITQPTVTADQSISYGIIP